MAGSVNKVIIVGNLGKTPELRRTPGGAAVTDFPVATTDRFKGKDGSRQEQTEWHNIVVWNRQAENACQYLKKGSSVYIEGSLRTRTWDDQNGQKRYKTEIMAQSIQFLDKIGGDRPQGGNSGGSFGEPAYSGGDSYNQAPQQNQGFGGGNAPAQQNQGFGGGAPAQSQSNQGFGGGGQQSAPAPAPAPIDDDLPF